MANSPNEHCVVAGVSSKDDEAVVRWAAGEAAGREAVLRLVTARDTAHRYLTHTNWVAAERLLAELAAEATLRWPGLAVTTAVTAGSPAEVLRDVADTADLLVVGADIAGAFVEAMRGSVPGDLLTTAPCPLVVVPRRGWTTPAPTPVVVALDGVATSQPALAYGYAVTARTGQPLRILRCVNTGSRDPGTAQARLLMIFEELYPDVVVSTDVVLGDPRSALLTASRRAALLVLGARGRFESGLFGSVSRQIIRNSECPVVVAGNSGSTVAFPRMMRSVAN